MLFHWKGRKCTECQRNARQTTTKSQEDFIKELNEVNPQIIPLEPYQGIYKKILCECKICGNEWETSPHQLLIGRGCQKCKRRWQTSFPEQALLYYLKPLYSDIECSYKKGFGNSELDLFIPSLMIGIEYDGMRWHKGRVEVEQRKYELCKAQNIFLIRMRESIEGVELEKICDHWIETKYGREKKTEALDVSITELILYLGNSMSDDYVNTDRDRLNIQSSYYSEIGDRSLESIAPEIAKEWYQPKNGKIKPSMVRAGTNDMFYWKCWVCGFVYPATVYTRISGHGCPKCAGVMNKSHEAFLEEAKKANPNTIVLSEYTNATTKVCVQCMKCGFVGMVSPRTILKGGGCRVCNNKKAGLEKTIKQEDFIEDIKDKHPDIEVLGEYTGSHKRIRCHCKKCGYEWNPIAGSLRNGKVGCPNCAGNRRRRVLCIETGMEYESMGQAEKDTGINHSSISQCCKGLSKTAGGYHWKYYKE